MPIRPCGLPSARIPPGRDRAEGGDGFYAAYFQDLDGNKLDLFCYV